jgi:putative spermidine/putrescine transport system substrate-binding protein
MSEQTEMQDYRGDFIAILKEETQGRTVHRRRFLQTLALFGVSASAVRFAAPANAQASKEIVVVNWGGDAVKQYDEIWAQPFNKANPGLKAIVDGTGPTSGKIKAMVDSGAVTWDACDRNLPASIELGRQGLLEKVDWTIVDKDKLRPIHRTDWGVGSYLYSFALTWDKAALKGKTPANWADFWNVKEFPGKRTLRNNIEGMLEAALLADGVPPEKVYPIDLDRALAKIKEIKPHTIFWTSGAESQTLFRNKEVVLGNLWHTRAMYLQKELGDAVQFSFNQGILFAGAWIVPKGNPAKTEVWRFIASTQDPQSQVRMLQEGNGPINPAADPLVPAALKSVNCGSPENLAKQIAVDAEWYAANYGAALARYLDVISS